MTKGNVAAWWGVAKLYLDETWENEKSEFDPLIVHLKVQQVSAKYPHKSQIKSRVIDNALKEAFEALARPDL
jgi:hypothetical protein